MKLKRKYIERDGSGEIVFIPEESDDMWHCYNLICVGDKVKSITMRRVQLDSECGYGSSERVRTWVTISVESIQYEQGGLLRLNGKNVVENEYVKMGAYHSLELKLGREFTLFKEQWDSIAMELVHRACDVTQYADVGAVIMSEGLAHVCLITSTMTVVRAKIENSIPKKRTGSVSGHEKGLQRFFEMVMQGILRHFNFDVIKCVIIASPGFVKDQFFTYMQEEAQKHELKVLIENKAKFLLVHSSSGHKYSLKDILSDPSLQGKLADTKAAAEVRALNRFYEMMKCDPNRAFYGWKHVQLANERLSIETLLINDDLFRASDVPTRKKYVEFVESVKENGGEVKLFSTLHVSGEQLSQLGGVAAILRFPLPEIEDEYNEEEEANTLGINESKDSQP